MLRRILHSGGKLAQSRHSRALQTSTIHRNTGDKKDDENDPDYWQTPIEDENPFTRTHRVMGHQFRQLKEKAIFWKDPKPVDSDDWGIDSADFPSHVDIVIVGGGIVGSMVAFWLKKLSGESFTVVILEKDLTYRQCSTSLSTGGVRQQFSLEENIEMSLFGAEFIRNARMHLQVPQQPPVDIDFHHKGYLMLASEEGVELLARNSKFQNSKGACNKIMSAAKLKLKFPWLNTDGIVAGCLGLEQEGWFDPWRLLQALKQKNISMGVEYHQAEAKGFVFSPTPNMTISSNSKDPNLYRKLNHIVVKAADGSKKVIQFALIVIAAGAASGAVAKLAKVGNCTGILSVPLYTEPRKRYVYCFHAPDGPGLNTPMVIDPSGMYFRREGLANFYIAGKSPSIDEEPTVNNLDVDDDFFQEKIWPKLSHRVPSFENLKVVSSWAGFYDYNPYDENAVIGSHPLYSNMYFATGFSGHGIQQAAAAGRGIAEQIVYSRYRTIDLTRLGFERFITQEPLYEENII